MMQDIFMCGILMCDILMCENVLDVFHSPLLNRLYAQT